MPFTSNQIGQMIGGQQVMFSNQAQFAHQVGSMAGTLPPGTGFGGGMQSPSFGRADYAGQDIGFASTSAPGGYGAGMVGGMAGAIPGMAAGVSMAGGLGLLGHMGGYLDPFTGTARAFAGGAGAAGQGFMGTMGHIGGAFARGGARAGLGAIGGGLAAAALPAAAYYAAGQAISYGAEQIYGGAQDITQVGGMAQQYLGPQYGQAGARPGGMMGRGQISQITGVLREIAGEETMASMSDLKQMMDRAGQMGMLSGITNANQFQQKFKRIVSQAKDIAKIMGTTLEEAMPMLQNMQQMGMWRASDIMGTSVAMQAVGPQGRGALMGTMQSAAQRSHAMGGSLAAGAAIGRQSFMNVQAALQAGTLSPEMIQEFTGGVGGAEGQRMVAERMAGAMQNVAQTPVGRLGMAGLAEMKGGRFTGRIDEEKMRAFQEGRISINQLQQMGQRATRTREGAASFTYRQEQLGQSMMATGGMEGMAAMFQAGLDKAGFGGASEEIQGIMLQKIFGLQRRDAHMIQRIMRDLPQITEQRQRRELDALNDAFQRAEEKQNRSWDGFKDSLKGAWEKDVSLPLRELGADISTRMNQEVDTLTDAIWGRTRRMNITRAERVRRLAAGGLGAAPANIQALAGQGVTDAITQTPMAERLRRGGMRGMLGMGQYEMESTRAGALMATGEVGLMMRERGDVRAGEMELGSTGGLMGAAFGGLMGGVAGAISEATGGTSMVVNTEALRRQHKRVLDRAFDPESRLKGTGEARQNAITRAKQSLRKAMNNPDNMRELIRLKKEGKGKGAQARGRYQRALADMLQNEDPEVIRMLSAEGGPTGAIDVLAAVEKESEANLLSADFKTDAADMGALAFMSSSKLQEVQEDAAASALGALSGQRELTGFGIAAAGAIGGMAGLLTGGTGLVVGGIAAGAAIKGLGIEGLTREAGLEGVDRKDLEGILSTEIGADLIRFAETGEMSSDLQDALGRDEKLQTVFAALKDRGPEGMKQFAEHAKIIGQARNAEVSKQVAAERASLAGKELSELKKGAPKGLKRALELTKSAGEDIKAQLRAGQRVVDIARGMTDEELKALQGQGGAMAEHMRDVANIQRLDPEKMAGMGGQQLRNLLRQKGLTQDFALMGAAGGRFEETHKEIMETMEGGGKLSSRQARRLKRQLEQLEERTGATEEGAGRDNAQDKMMMNMTKYTQANEKFVLAVAAAVPELKKVGIEQIKKEISESAANAKPE